MKKRIFSGLLASVLLAGGSAAAFAGCGPKSDDTVKIDTTKTQIFVGNEANGYGTEWLDKTIDAFEAWAAEKSYEPGKKGVQVITSSSGFAGGPLLNTLSGSQANVVFSEECYYYDYLSKKVTADITDAVTTPLTEFGEEKSIEQKMVADNGNQLKDALTGHDGKYYALPWWSGLQGITYDVDLFNAENLFIKKGGSPSEYARTENAETGVAAPLSGSFTSYQWTNDEGELAAGPDGKYGTYDDGLPATYEEFYALCERMLNDCTKRINPITYTGQYQYGEFVVREMFYDYEGYENARFDIDFTGTAYDIVENYNTNPDGSIDFDSITYMGGANGVKIDKTNGYLANQQVGKLYAMTFAKTLVDNEYLAPACFTSDYSHTAMQEYFLKGKYSKYGFDTSAMLVEGTWWIGQARNVFDSMEAAGDEKSGYNQRELAFMPFPKADESRIGTGGSIRSRRSAMCFINGNIKDENILSCATDFFRFCHTDEALKIFNQTTGGIRPFDFEYSAEELENISTFSSSTYNLNKEYDIVYPYAYNDLYLNHQSNFSDQQYGYFANIDGVGDGTKNVFRTFKNYPNVTVADYFEGIKSYYSKSDWDNKYSKYYN